MIKSFKLPVIMALLFSFLSLPAVAGYVWVGEQMFNVTRASTTPCEIDLYSANRLTLASWAYQRATVAGVCFQVYAEGVTEFYRTDIAKYLTVEINLIDTANHSTRTVPARYVKHINNNAIFFAELRDLNWLYAGEQQSKTEWVNYFKIWDAANNADTYHNSGLLFAVEHQR